MDDRRAPWTGFTGSAPAQGPRKSSVGLIRKGHTWREKPLAKKHQWDESLGVTHTPSKELRVSTLKPCMDTMDTTPGSARAPRPPGG